MTTEKQHLVIAGGGIAGICLYTAIRESHKRGEWRTENIKSIHAVSAGTMIATIIALRYDWDVIDEYIISRPLHNLFKWENISFMNVFYNCGMIDRTIFVDFLRPFFAGAESADIDVDITMREFREKTGISMHFYCTELMAFEKVEMSAEKTPDLAVIDAIYRSCTIPFIMCPQRGVRDGGAVADPPNLPSSKDIQNGEHDGGAVADPPNGALRAPLYVDGYLKTNYPSRDCIIACSDAAGACGAEHATEDNILGFRLKTPYTDVKNMIDLAKSIIFAIGNSALYPLKHEYVIDYNCFDTFDDIYLFFKSAARRREIIISKNNP